jgi:hypothetical protein
MEMRRQSPCSSCALDRAKIVARNTTERFKAKDGRLKIKETDKETMAIQTDKAAHTARDVDG